MTDNIDRIQQIEHKIFHAIHDGGEAENYENNEVLSALVGIFTFYLSMRCPACRQDIAKTLKKKIPGMLAEANLLAASYEGEKSCTTHQ